MVRWQAKLGQTDEVEKAIIDFSKILRASFDNSAYIIQVKDELEFVISYCDIQKYFIKHLEVSIDVDETILDCMIPKLILISVIENSIVHGFSAHIRNPRIMISGRREGEFIEFRVNDNGNGIAPDKLSLLNNPSSSVVRVGIHNVRRRIELFCGDGGGLWISSPPDGGTEVLILIKENPENERIS